jgi:hypothetical protein
MGSLATNEIGSADRAPVRRFPASLRMEYCDHAS